MTDAGVKFLEAQRAKMMIDDEWTQQRERGFTWWAFRLAQHFEVPDESRTALSPIADNISHGGDVFAYYLPNRL